MKEIASLAGKLSRRAWSSFSSTRAFKIRSVGGHVALNGRQRFAGAPAAVNGASPPVAGGPGPCTSKSSCDRRAARTIGCWWSDARGYRRPSSTARRGQRAEVIATDSGSLFSGAGGITPNARSWPRLCRPGSRPTFSPFATPANSAGRSAITQSRSAQLCGLPPRSAAPVGWANHSAASRRRRRPSLVRGGLADGLAIDVKPTQLHRLFQGGVGNKNVSCRLAFGVDATNHNVIVQWLALHGGLSIFLGVGASASHARCNNW
jgi:hypothetical protein